MSGARRAFRAVPPQPLLPLLLRRCLSNAVPVAQGPRFVWDTPFQEGDYVIVRECSHGAKSNMIGPLEHGKVFGTRRGDLRHSDILGRLPRERVKAYSKQEGRGGMFMAHHPTLEEQVGHNRAAK
ncbi:hypothetical protein EV182_000525 [Spiromyces aspiralis]|uniref:Uncharacterized protein n=1 Tax=Spiromyces aspiralis TaxID=68401 RepID=A0ACC1HYG8_9FUNG|nr:hypothetical protein EV182_000525 [Spiromyces aspiralis]